MRQVFPLLWEHPTCQHMPASRPSENAPCMYHTMQQQALRKSLVGKWPHLNQQARHRRRLMLMILLHSVHGVTFDGNPVKSSPVHV